ncbi:MAG: hypothetical protein KJZ78_10395 [Bryobacteraceae bacterium]|nr:hypothetical protein [Bryobacteraceae bacterium]
MSRWVFAVLASAAGLAPLYAQVEAGVIGGVPLTHFILDHSAGSRVGSSTVTSAPRRYTLGPSIGFGLSGPLSLEASALYKRFGFDTFSIGGFPTAGVVRPIVSINSSTTGNSWEFPVLAKLRLHFLPGVNAYLSAGPSIRRLSGIRERGVRTERILVPAVSTVTTSFETSSPETMNRRTSFGAVFGTGLDFRAGPVRLSPGIRLTRWDTERTSSTSAPSRLARTQAEAVLRLAYTTADRLESPPAKIPCCLELGVLAGVSLQSASDIRTETLPSSVLYAPAHRYTTGVLLDWRFHSRLSLEGSFLLRRVGHVETNTIVQYTTSLTAHSWEVPLLLKWRPARIGPATVVIGGGPALRRVSHIEWVTKSLTDSFRSDGSFLNRSALGVAASGGVEFKTGAMRLHPEFRYTRFERPLYDFYYIRTRQDSLALLIGVNWARTSR